MSTFAKLAIAAVVVPVVRALTDATSRVTGPDGDGTLIALRLDPWRVELHWIDEAFGLGGVVEFDDRQSLQVLAGPVGLIIERKG